MARQKNLNTSIQVNSIIGEEIYSPPIILLIGNVVLYKFLSEVEMLKILKWLDDYLEEAILVILLILMTLIMGLQVTMRYVFRSSLSWSEELVRFMFVWSTFISVPFCIKHGISIKIDQFRSAFPKKIKKVLLVTDKVILFGLFAVLTYYAVDVVRLTLISGQTSAALGLPMEVVQVSTIIGFGLACVRILQNLFRVLKGEEVEV